MGAEYDKSGELIFSREIPEHRLADKIARRAVRLRWRGQFGKARKLQFVADWLFGMEYAKDYLWMSEDGGTYIPYV